MSVSFCVTHKRHIISCNDKIIDKIILIIMEEAVKQQLVFIFIVGHLGFLIYVNDVLMGFHKSTLVARGAYTLRP